MKHEMLKCAHPGCIIQPCALEQAPHRRLNEDQNKLALYHVRLKPLSRGSRNTVSSLAYRAGTVLECQRTGEVFDYTKKNVQHCELLLPDNAPEWAKDLQELIAQDRQKGVQKLSDLAEAAEKRVDARVYRDYEFALHRELTDEQNIALAKELIQDQMCKLGIPVLVNFHFDIDKKTGERKPHCHAVMLTRRFTEEGFAQTKDPEWETLKVLKNWNEQVAAYGNFHLRMHGFEPSLDHRSYKERQIDIEPQPKLGRNVQEMESRAGQDVKSLNSKPITDKGREYQESKLRNLYKIIKRPEIIFEMIGKTQSTFMWGDVQKKLAQYVDDTTLFQRLDAQLKSSKELVFLRALEGEDRRPDEQKLTQDNAVYTWKEMLKAEMKLVQLAESLSQNKKHGVSESIIEKTIAKYNQKLAEHGGLSQDQIQAIRHMVSPNQLTCVVGYAGAGKTTALEVAKEIWEQSGYKVYGLAPTGRARENLKQNSFKSDTLHKFLKDYENGRCQYDAKSVLVLDEGGMVNTQRFQKLLSAVERLGVKAVNVGDGAQLQPVESGPAHRLVTERIGYAKLEYVVRQKEDWQKESTVLFGQNRTREALVKYHEHGCIRVCQEKVASLEDLLEKQDFREVVSLYNLSRRVAGNVYHEMLKDTQNQYFLESDAWKYISNHVDYKTYGEWRDRRDACAQSIVDNLDQCRYYMKELGVDPVKFALNFVEKSLDKEAQIKEAQQLAKFWELPELDGHQRQHICDPREQTKKEMVQAWYEAYQKNPEQPKLMMSYSNKDVRDLNDQARFLLKQDGAIEKTEFLYTVHREQDTDFGKTLTFKEGRAFSKGDRLLFTRNDKGLGVNNGTLGTIESLDQNNIKVKLHDSDKVVSFAPKLYPYFDQGWAATIHKNQGATAKDSLVLASYEMYRNLTYVAMTRHNYTVTLFTSNVDFWSEEKIFDRLGRSQEKLSSLDYVSSKQLFAIMKEDDKVLNNLFDRLGNQLEAIKYVSKRSFQELTANLLGNTYEYEAPIPQDSILEEDRAREFFKDAPFVHMSYNDRLVPQHHQMSEVQGQGMDNTLEKGFQVSSTHTYQDQNGLQQQVDRIFAVALEKVPQEKISHSPVKTLDNIETLAQTKSYESLSPQSSLSHRFKPIAYYDRDEVLKHLSDSQVERIFHADIHNWVEVPKSIKQGVNIRYGSGKGFVINLDEKVWYNHYRSEGGDIISYVSLSKGISYGKALKMVAEESNAPQSTYLTPEEQAKRQHAWQQEKADQIQKSIEAGKVKSLKVFNKTQSIEGSLGEKYLNQHRGYLGAVPEDIRFCGSRYTPNGNYPSLVSFARDKNGDITGYQEIFLDPTTGNKAKDLEVVKRSGGHCKGSTVQIQKGEGVTYIAEGVETALSLKAAEVKGEILGGYGRYVFKNAEPQNKVIVFCADYDGANAKTHQALEKDKKHLEEKGYTVHIAWPVTTGERKVDFNDILKIEGVEKIQTLLKDQLPKIVCFELMQRSNVNTIDEKNVLKKAPVKDEISHIPASSRDDRAATRSMETKENAYRPLEETVQALFKEIDKPQYEHISQEWKNGLKEYSTKNPQEAIRLFEEVTQTKINLSSHPENKISPDNQLIQESKTLYCVEKVLHNALEKLKTPEFSYVSQEWKEGFKNHFQQNPREAMQAFEELTSTKEDKAMSLFASIHAEQYKNKDLNKPMDRELAMLFKNLDSPAFAQMFNKDQSWINDFKAFATRSPSDALEIYHEQTGVNIPQIIAHKDAEIAKAAALEKQRHEDFCSSVDKAAYQYEQLLTQRDEQWKKHEFREHGKTEEKIEKIVDLFEKNPQMMERLKSHHQETAKKVEKAIHEQQMELQRAHTRGFSMEM